MFQERQDEVVYYDTFESADDITEDDSAEREELRRLQASARQLEVRRGRITAKRSYLRNKRVSATILCDQSEHYHRSSSNARVANLTIKQIKTVFFFPL